MNKVSNAEFIEAISKPSKMLDGEDVFVWVCAKKGKDERDWKGRAYNKESQYIENRNLNNYFCVSKVRHKRKKENFIGMMCLTLDDVGTKAKAPNLTPSWIIETSPDNEQWGYIFEDPITDESKAAKITNSLIEKGFCDEGATGPSTRYMRLPLGSNDKPEHLKNNNGQPYQHKLIAWNPNLIYSVENLTSELELNLENNNKNHSKDKNNQNLKEKISDNELIQKIIKSDNYHNSLLQLAARYILRGISPETAIQILQSIMNANSDNSIRYKERYNDIPRLVETAVNKYSFDNSNSDSFKIISADEFIREKPISWIIKNIFPASGIAMIYGKPGSGKSFFALDIAGSIARGVDWNEKKVIQGKVIYIVAEGVAGFRKRIEAYCKYHKVNPDNFPFRIIAETPDLTKDNDEVLISKIRSDGGADIIVIDTLAQVSAGANENSAEDMGAVLKRCQNIQKKTGSLVLLIHHSGKDNSKGERGWSGIRGAMDTSIEIICKKTGKIAKIVKQKDGEDNFKISFNLKQIRLGTDEDLELITSCVVETKDTLVDVVEKSKGKLQQLIFEVLRSSDKKMNKEDFINEIIQEGRKSGNKRRKETVRRSVGNMLASSSLEEDEEGIIQITQQHNTSKNTTCVNVSNSEKIPQHTHHPIGMCSGVSDESCLEDLLG